MKKIVTLFLCLILSACYAGNMRKTADQFVGKPYLSHPLGEGEKGTVSTAPLYRLDGFDCVTYVETVLALNAPGSFHQNMNAIRYKDGQVNYETRNHFVETDWIPNNTKWVRDITASFPEAKKIQFNLPRNQWLMYRMQEKGINEPLPNNSVPATFYYIPKDKITPAFLAHLPPNVVVNFARQNIPPEDPTPITRYVYHMGFLFNGKMLYHASYTVKKIVKIDLLEYMQTQTPDDFLGINILEIIRN